MKKHYIRFIIFLLPLLIYQNTFSQESKKDSLIFAFKKNEDSIREINSRGRFKIIQAQYHTGGQLYGGDLLNKDLEKYFAITLKFGWKNSKNDNWGEYFNEPTYGVGLYTGSIGDRDIFGLPHAVYGFMSFPLRKPWRKTQIELTPNLGLTYNLAEYDPIRNPTNDAISSSTSLYFRLEMNFISKLSREMDFLYGIDFFHASNGRLYTPNWGLNMFGINLGVRYYYNREQKFLDPDKYTTNVLPSRYIPILKKKNELIKKHSINILTAVGNVENYVDEDLETDTSKRYWTNSLAIDYVYRYNTMFSFNGGLDYFRDSSLVTKYPNSKDWNIIGIHAGADFNFWRMIIRAQVGTYLTDDRQKDQLFFRPAIMYNINDWLKVSVGLKTRHGFSADWIEWGLTFVPFSWNFK